MESLMSKIIAISVGLLMVAVLVPIALTTFMSKASPLHMVKAGANVTGVDPVVVTVLTVLLPILAIKLVDYPQFGDNRHRALASLWPTHSAAKFYPEDEVIFEVEQAMSVQRMDAVVNPSLHGRCRPNATLFYNIPVSLPGAQ
jgi:hypothetical protein